MTVVLVLLLLFTSANCALFRDKPTVVKVVVKTTSAIAYTNEKFLSVTLDVNITSAKWAKLNLGYEAGNDGIEDVVISQ